jgi:hypothetical protein
MEFEPGEVEYIVLGERVDDVVKDMMDQRRVLDLELGSAGEGDHAAARRACGGNGASGTD